MNLWVLFSALLLYAAGAGSTSVPCTPEFSRGDSIPNLLSDWPGAWEKHCVQTQDGYILSLFRLFGRTTSTQPQRQLPGAQFEAHGQAAQAVEPAAGAASRRTATRKLTSSAPGATSKHQARLNQGAASSSGSPRGQASSKGFDSTRPQVLMQHGLLDSCAGFLLSGPDSALAFLLADAGFDVWLANSRGSTQSRAHAWLPVDSAAYWAFSFDEMAAYDLPAELDYIQNKTGVRKVNYVGHSQGTTVLLAALASQPDLADRLGLAVLLAPVAMARHVTSIPMRALATLGTDGIFTAAGLHEFMPSVRFASWLEGHLCTVRPELCVSILAAICGYRRHAVNETKLPLYLKYTPAGTSVQNMAHWAQSVRGGSTPGRPAFTAFDYGTNCGLRPMCNQKKYGSNDPPEYQLASISPRAKLALFTGGQDSLADPIDTELLLESLPEGVVRAHQHDPDLEHLDYIWGIDAPDRIYSKVLALLLDDVSSRTGKGGHDAAES